ncbi:hypothetical protein [Streptomyces sp. NPDC048106]|uniref:hypothetical protein n=1 Tax=Streptomyces sp. NPDC048106 TaxID=3155750 RepID=UPI0034515958
MAAESITETVLAIMGDKPREQTAFSELIAALRDEGHQAELMGSPERQSDHYPFVPPIPVDAEIAIGGLAGFVDHTVLPAPQENKQRVATQDAVAHGLIERLTGIATRAPGGGLIVSVGAGPWMGAKPKERDRLYARVVAMATKAVERGKPFVDMRQLPRGPFPVPTIGFWDCPDELRVIVSFDDITVGWSGRWAPDGRWRVTLREMRGSVGRAIEGKLTKQLAGVRAVAPSKPIGLLIDSRPMLSPGKGKPEPVMDFPPDVVGALVSEIATDWPGVLTRAWLLSPTHGVVAVYGDGVGCGW